MARFDNSGSCKPARRFSLPKRSKRYGVGKEIGGAVYVHRSYEQVLGSAVEAARRHLPPEFCYTVVKLNLTTKSVSFVEVADFDSAPEPTIDTIITVRADGSTKRTLPPSDPFIYHHKWLFVKDDYDGFDVEESKARSQAHMVLDDIDRTRIGRRNYWNTEVVPRLPAE